VDSDVLAVVARRS